MTGYAIFQIEITNPEEYKNYVEKDRALSRRFQKIDVDEPSVAETFEILKGLQGRYEEHHGIKYVPEALEAAAELANRYINDRFLPDKAIDVIDEAGAACRLAVGRKRRKITVRDVEKGQEETEHSIQTVLHTEEVLLPIITLVEDVRKMNEQMKQAAQTQNQLVSGVNTQLEHVVDMSDEVAESADKTGKSGHILQTISQSLQKLVHQFKF